MKGVDSNHRRRSEDADWLKFVYDIASKAKDFAQSWDQALSPTAAEVLLDNIAKLFQLSITPQQFADNLNAVIGPMTALAPPVGRKRRPVRLGRRAERGSSRVAGGPGARLLRRVRRHPAAGGARPAASPSGTASATIHPDGPQQLETS